MTGRLPRFLRAVPGAALLRRSPEAAFRALLRRRARAAAAEGPAAATRDPRAEILALRNRVLGTSFSAPVLAHEYPRGLAALFPHLRPREAVRADPAAPERLLMLGAVLDDAPGRQRGTAEMVALDGPDTRKIFTEQAFLGSAFSWLAPDRTRPEAACLGYIHDDLAQYYMADYPSRMIRWLNGPEEITAADRARARALIDRLVASRVSKYNAQPIRPLPPAAHRRVLVCDQSFADASIRYGRMGPADFAAMLAAARAEAPDAEILVKTHPDTAWSDGARAGYFDHLTAADGVTLLRAPINPYCLIEAVDTVYAGTSQIGLEALLAGKRVVTFGAPFYAGWGLTDDRQAIPHRHRARDLETLVHAAYIRAPLYHVPGRDGPAEVETVVDFIEANRPVAPPRPAPRTPPEVSVIVPVRDGAGWIGTALASVQNQTLTGLEILVVDDASGDATADIVADRAAADPRIRLVRQDTAGGPGRARNTGLDAARGTYVWLLDSDDVLADPGVLADLVAAARADGADVVRARKAAERVLAPDGTVLADRPDPAERLIPRAARGAALADLPELAHNRHCWLLLYRREMLEQARIRFATGFWEERAFALAALLAARRITVLDRAATRYTLRPGSVARRDKTEVDAADMLGNLEAVVARLARHGAVARTSPLRPLLETTLSQFLHVVLFGFFRAVAAAAGPATRRDWAARLAAAFDAADLDPEDLRPAPGVVDPGALAGGRYGLALAALRAGRADLVDCAVAGTPVDVADMVRTARGAPGSALARAIVAYARHTGSTSAAPPQAPRQEVRLLVHAGLSKTGTTALQHWLEANRAALLARGVYVPERGIWVQPGRPHKTGGHAPFLAAAETGAPELRTHVEAALAADPGLHTVLVSSEGFHLGPAPWRVLEYFSGMQPKVLIWLRRQDDWAASQYREYVGGGATFPVADTPEDWLARPETRARLDHESFVAEWAARLPEGALRLRRYPDPDGLIAGFLDAAGLAPGPDLVPPAAGLGNEAVLDGAYLEAMREMNARPWPSTTAYLAFVEAVHGIARRHRPDAAPPQVLSAAAREALMAACAPGNARLARRFGLPDLPAAPAGAAAPPAPPLSAAERAEIAAARRRHAGDLEPDPPEIAQLRAEMAARLAPLPEAAIAAAAPRLAAAGLFDPAFYRARYPDVAAAGIDPLAHFLRSGCAEGRDPHPAIDTLATYRARPDLLARGQNLLMAFLAEGRGPDTETDADAAPRLSADAP
ncbi:putative glycosyltransferase EpsJ [Roseivivax jejudonensis]|uniref:Putative glycosyltransferase EpsJ n=1 Tax=Roseivivax jejudonensis TaxID=1529041 RepID=A0A1X6YW18_9RHOB|nr:glycosyltransferase [Roseivivax jejudonensis]SLN33199.1 putative glycosyltransferase EpsJ [Roseivivax jejudonensis]